MKKHSMLKRVIAVFLILLMMFSAMPAGIFSLSASAYRMPDPIDHLVGEYASDSRIDMDFNKNWKFHLGDISDGYKSTLDHTDWDDVNLPHDFSITREFAAGSATEVESGLLPGGTGWYRKAFTLPTALKDKRIILTFDGAYKDTYVYVNNTLVGENHYGYNAFSFDITPYLTNKGSSTINGAFVNLIAVKVENKLPSSRWYSGSGISRDVFLTAVDPVHVSLYGTQVTTPDIATGGKKVKTSITLQNDSTDDKTVYVKTQLIDPASGNILAENTTTDPTTVSAGSTETVERELTPTADIELWSPENPKLYIVRTIIKDTSLNVVDQYDTTFGYRYVRWDRENGFYLNGNNIKLKGVCMHHDQGALGAVQTYDSIYRQMAKLKEMGCNAIRTSHNVAADVYLKVCNEIGMLVLDEFFDGWKGTKNGNEHDFSEYCLQTINTSKNALVDAENGEEWYKFITRQTVKRDRNNPSVIAWDYGNELEGVDCDDTNGKHIAENMRAIIDANDAYTFVADSGSTSGNGRPVTWGNNKGSLTHYADNNATLLGGNYHVSEYYPTSGTNSGAKAKPFVGTETASAVNSRGVYKNTRGQNASADGGDYTAEYTKNRQINSYDASRVHWGNTAATAWYFVAANAWNSGEFVWTGFDYIGEPTPYNKTGSIGTLELQGGLQPNSSYFGIIDMAGFEKDSFYLYRSLWNETSNTLHMVPGTWVRSELMGDTVPVAVYANGDAIKRVELYLNGTKVGTATATAHTVGAHTYYTWSTNTDAVIPGAGSYNLYPAFNVTWAEGTLTVKGFNAVDGGTEVTNTVGTTSITSNVGEVSRIEANVVTPTVPYADGDSYIFVEYTARDAQGNFVNAYNGTIQVSLEGSTADCVIAGVDNGNAATLNKFQNSNVFDITGNTATQSDRQKANVEFFNGKALVIVRALNHIEPGIMRLAQVEQKVGGNTVDPYVEGATVNIAADDLKDEFEEICPQGNVEYSISSEDSLDEVRKELKTEAEGIKHITTDESVVAEDGYYRYKPTFSGEGNYIENGEYVIYCPNPIYRQKNTNDPRHAVVRTTMNSVSGDSNKGLLSDKNSVVINDNLILSSSLQSSDVTFRFTSTGSGNEYKLQIASGANANKYVSINKVTGGAEKEGNVTLSDAVATVNIRVTDDKEVIIYKEIDGHIFYFDLFAQIDGASYPFSAWANNSANGNDIFELYKYKELKSEGYYKLDIGNDSIIPDGKYVINHPASVGNANKVVENYESTIGNGNNAKYGLRKYTGGTIIGDKYDPVSSEHDIVFDITSAQADTGDDRDYYIQNSSGEYLTVTENNNRLTFEEEKQPVKIYIQDDGKILIYHEYTNETQSSTGSISTTKGYCYLDYFNSEQFFSTWGTNKGEPGSDSMTDPQNNLFCLYRYQPQLYVDYIHYTHADETQPLPGGKYVLLGTNATSASTANSGRVLIKTSDNSKVKGSNSYEFDEVNDVITLNNINAIANIEYSRTADNGAYLYYISFVENNTVYYFTIGDSGAPSFSTTKSECAITFSDGKILIKNTGLSRTAGFNTGTDDFAAGSNPSTDNYKLEMYRPEVYYREVSDKEIYSYYTPDDTSAHIVHDGWYALYGRSRDGGHYGQYTYGYLSSDYYNSNNNRLTASQSHNLPTTDINKYAWHFQFVATNNSGTLEGYYISTFIGDTRYYLTINDNEGNGYTKAVKLVTTPTALWVSKYDKTDPGNDNAVMIYNGSSGNNTTYYINYTENSGYRGEVAAFSGSYCETPFELHPIRVTETQGTRKQVSKYTGSSVVAGDYLIIGNSGGSNHNYNRIMYYDPSVPQVKIAERNDVSTPFIVPADPSDYYIWHLNGSTTSIKNVGADKYLDRSLGNGDPLDTLTTSSTLYYNVLNSTRGSNNFVFQYATANSFINCRAGENVPSIWNTDYNTGIADWGNSFALYSVNYVSGTVRNYEISQNTYRLNTKPKIDDGRYIIYNKNGGLALGLDGYNGTVESATVEYDSAADKLKAESVNEYTFTNVYGTDSWYYVQNSDGEYLNVGNTLSFTDTPAMVYVGASNNTTPPHVRFSNKDASVNTSYNSMTYNSTNKRFNSSSVVFDETQRMYLYKDTDTLDITKYYVGEETGNRLYDTIKHVLAEYPGDCDEKLYKEMLEYAATCIAALKAGQKTDKEYNEMADTLDQMHDNLGIAVKTFSATLFKYGYDPNATTTDDSYYQKYFAKGGYDYDIQSIQIMKQKLINEYSNQITALSAGGTSGGGSWTVGLSEAEIAAGIDKIAEAYARLYTLQFTGKGRNKVKDGVSGTPEDKNNGKLVTSDNTGKHYSTAWNWWTKKYCFDTVEGENSATADEGASILGLYSLQLGADGLPHDHSVYENPLEYVNVSARGDTSGLLSNMSVTVSGKTVELTPLSNIAVYVPDMFKRENVAVGLNDDLPSLALDPSGESGYSKYYWDTEFPFHIVKSDNGDIDYVYDSHDKNYMYRAYYNDDDNTAVSILQPMTSEGWNVDTKTSRNDGFFPFNYQLTDPDGDDRTNFKNELAVYHYGMNFGGQFLMPDSGKNISGTDITFDFKGDDDVLVYVDGQLVLNNGGLHGKRAVSINFTQETITYQFAFDIEQNKVINVANNDVDASTAAPTYVTFKWGAPGSAQAQQNTANGVTDGIQAGLDLLHKIHTEGLGQEHSFDFFYLERGSTESNCYIKFNLPQTDKLIREDEHTHVVDYAQTIKHTVDVDDFQKKINTRNDPTYLGIILGDNYVGNEISITDSETQIMAKLDYQFENNQPIVIEDDGKFGRLTFDTQGNSTFKPNSMTFDGVETFYIILKFREGLRNYYCVEKINYIPATTVYYEDSFESISYEPVAQPDTNTKYAWSVAGDEVVKSLTADIAGDRSMRLYGANDEYPVSATYSSGAAHKVTVDNKTFKTLGKWPTASFTFAGTGFDVISLTSNKSGIFVINVFPLNENGEKVYDENYPDESPIMPIFVDTYYGYTYGALYFNVKTNKTVVSQDGVAGDGLLKLYATDYTAMQYRDMDEAEKAKYIVTSVGNKVYSIEDNGLGAAFGWVPTAQTEEENALYQVPVVRVTDLDYGSYYVEIEARYASFGHNLSSADLYLDAIRIYDPAGVANTDSPSEDKTLISDSYASDNENYANFTEIKSMLVGADTLTNGSNHEGIIFIDGNDAITNEMLSTYDQIGPNHELYLDGQTNSIAFEIWATAVPEDIQIGAKIAKGDSVTLRVTNDYNHNCDRVIRTATDMYYSLDTLLAEPITWKLRKDPNTDTWYYTSGTIVITNAAAKGNILSITNVKWTFGVYGAEGQYRIPIATAANNAPAALNEPEMVFAVNSAIEKQAYRMMSAPEDVLVTEDDVKVENTDITVGSNTVINITTPVDVENLVITDKSGRVITPDELDNIITELDGKQVKQWTATIVSSQAGTYTYYIVGEYEGGYTSGDPVAVTVNVKAPEVPSQPGEDNNDDDNTDNNEGGIMARLRGLFERIRDFFVRLLSIFQSIG